MATRQRMASSRFSSITSTWPRKYPSRVTPIAHSSAADDVEGDEGPVPHVADAGHDRRERADDRDEPGQHDGLGAVLVEERLGLVDVRLLEQPAVRPPEDGRPDPLAEQVAHLVADHRGHEAADEQRAASGRCRASSIDERARGEEPGGEEEGVAGEEEADEQAGLGEDDRPDAEQTDLVDQFLGIERAAGRHDACEHRARLVAGHPRRPRPQADRQPIVRLGAGSTRTSPRRSGRWAGR